MSTAVCAQCGRVLDASAILDHLRLVHGEDVTLDTWPDGGVVVIDKTLEPSDFGEAP